MLHQRYFWLHLHNVNLQALKLQSVRYTYTTYLQALNLQYITPTQPIIFKK